MNNIIIDGMSYAMPLLIIAIGGIYCERSGITNLALEGLQGVGAFTGALFIAFFGGNFATDSHVPMYIAFLFAALGGAIYSSLHALICIKFKANQVISGVVINILSVSLTSFLTKQINASVFGTPSDKFLFPVSPKYTIPGVSKIPLLGAFFKNFYPYQVIIIALLLIFWFILYKTKFGMHLRAAGDNPQAVDAAGISVEKTRFKAVMISGALSGFGGMCFAYLISTNFSPVSSYIGVGYLSIAALIFGNWKIMPTFFACLIFGFARSGGYQLTKVLGFPSAFQDITAMLPYVVTLLLLIFFSKNNKPPRALGEVYDKGKR